MAELLDALRPLDASTVPRRYPAFWAGRLEAKNRRYLEAMWHVAVGDEFVVEYLADLDRFRVSRVEHADGMDPLEGFVDDPSLAEVCEQRLLVYVGRPVDVEAGAAAARIARRRLQQ